MKYGNCKVTAAFSGPVHSVKMNCLAPVEARQFIFPSDYWAVTHWQITGMCRTPFAQPLGTLQLDIEDL
jgi:hypothetical protein